MLWNNLEALIAEGQIISTKECLKEITQRDNIISKWSKQHGKIFEELSLGEDEFIKNLLTQPKYRAMINLKIVQEPKPFADIFVISKAKVTNGIVVTEEKGKPNAVKIPNVCDDLGIACINLIKFMQAQKWKF